MAPPLKLKKGASAVAAKLARKRAPEPKGGDLGRQLSLRLASAQSGQSLIAHRVVPPLRRTQELDGDADSGAGLAARMRAFLSLRGFDPSGVTCVQGLSTPTRTHRERRLLANAGSPVRQPQQPKLNTVPRSTSQLKEPRVRDPVSVRMKPTGSRRSRSVKAKPLQVSDATLSISSIGELRRNFGMNDRDRTLKDAVYIAIDTEGSYDVTEIGISMLDTRDISNITPDHRASNWISKVKHQHLIIGGSGSKRHKSTLFCKSEFNTAAEARALLLSRLQLTRQPNLMHRPRKVYLVGQSIMNDVQNLRCSAKVHLDLSHGPTADFHFDGVYDTHEMAAVAKSHGAEVGALSLGALARTLGVDAKYWKGSSVIGTHNASNDAAYTIMVMLLLAVRWPTLATELAHERPRRDGDFIKQLRVKARGLWFPFRNHVRTSPLRDGVAIKVGERVCAKAHKQAGAFGMVRLALRKYIWGMKSFSRGL